MPELPQFEGPYQIMLDFVKVGTMPGTAAVLAGLGSDWKSGDPRFTAAINVAHAYCQAKAEINAHELVTSKKAIPSGLQFYLQAVCGWRTKYGEDGFAQELHIHVQGVDGYQCEGDDRDLPRPPIRKNADVAKGETSTPPA